MRTPNLVLFILFFLLSPILATANDCSDCSRRGYVKLPDNSHEELVWSSLTTSLAEVFITDCFHMTPAENEAEYRFEVSYRTDIAGEVDEDGDPVKSCLAIKLFHDETNELVRSWKTEAHNNNLLLHYRRMFRHSDAVLKKDRPIEPYLWEFEKRPVKAKIKLEHKDIFGNEMSILEINNIVDEEGVAPREFNRIIVCPDKGKIDAKLLQNSEQWEMDPKCGVFRVGKGPLFVPYIAPSVNNCAGDMEQIIIYNSCDILHPEKLSLAKTRSREEIAVKQFGLICLKPKKLRMKRKMHMLQDICDGSTETTIRATAEIRLGEPKTFRNTSSGYPKTWIPLESINLVDFFAEIIRIDENGERRYTCSNPYYTNVPSWQLNKIKAKLHHDKDNYRKMVFFYIHPIYYKFKWSHPDWKDGGFGYYFLEHSDVPVMPELGIQNYWFDQMVTEGDGYHEYGGKGYRLTESDGLQKEEWFEWSFVK